MKEAEKIAKVALKDLGEQGWWNEPAEGVAFSRLTLLQMVLEQAFNKNL